MGQERAEEGPRRASSVAGGVCEGGAGSGSESGEAGMRAGELGTGGAGGSAFPAVSAVLRTSRKVWGAREREPGSDGPGALSVRL